MNATTTPNVSVSVATARPPTQSTTAVARIPRNSTPGRNVSDSDIALMKASRLALLTLSKRSSEAPSCAKAWMTRIPERSSARSPITAAVLERVWRKAMRARRENHIVINTMSGTTLNAKSARCGLMDNMTPTIPTRSRISPTRVISPSESNSLMTPTSLITRDMVTPTM
ncbi:MAG: hypothetical protein BWY63_03524 [Chloroflexi bacterium ADurb.Bin360]|nr:MAG: hypothetical protein BWY63_03524 [Chloroflexi bacterium ADurb.Bin360]